MADFDLAKDKILLGGPERKSMVRDKEDLARTAYHEGGHAVVASFTPGANPVAKATITARGDSLGMTVMLPTDDGALLQSRKQLLAALDVAMGGRIAEELIYGAEHVTTGASNDLQQAARTANAMVLRFGMGSRVGLIALQDKDLSQLSAEMRTSVDMDVHELLESSYARARALLNKKRPELENLATALMKYETLDAQEVQLAMAGKKLERSI